MIILPDLPYGADALAPTLSGDTLRTHHDKHHAAYVEKTNALAQKAGLDGRPLEDIVREARTRQDSSLFNNAAQAWNHGFFWECMAPQPAQLSGALKSAIDQAFGGLDGFKTAFIEEGVGHFASGWVWLVSEGGRLKVISTHDADDTLVRDGVVPLLVCDLWEHAYYLDYKNARPKFLEAWFDKLVNWAFVADQLAAATGQGSGYRYPGPSQGEPLRQAS